jgi:hypothetical protein
MYSLTMVVKSVLRLAKLSPCSIKCGISDAELAIYYRVNSTFCISPTLRGLLSRSVVILPCYLRELYKLAALLLSLMALRGHRV